MSPFPAIAFAHSMRVIALSRYAIKGLSPDSLESVVLDCPGATFPDDRRYALIKSGNDFDPENPEWIHKEKFLCAFTAAELLAGYDTQYVDATRELTVWKRDADGGCGGRRDALLGPVDLSSSSGRDEAASFFEMESGMSLSLVTKDGPEHTHQFGNTRSGVRSTGDTRTIHIVNAATVAEVGAAIGHPIAPSRFRPNIVVEGLEAWKEFEAVGHTLEVCRGGEDGGRRLKFDVVARTVRG